MDLYLVMVVIISSGYPFFSNAVLMMSNSLASLDFEQIISARWTNVFIKLILRLRGQNDPYPVYEPVNLGLR